ncbi:MAG: aquaporin [Actinomycetes bacterium]
MSTPEQSGGSKRQVRAVQPHDFLDALEEDLADRLNDFHDPRQEWRRLVSEVFGTFFLVLVAAGAPMVMSRYPGTVTLAAAVTAPALMVMAIIMFMGKVSGAHLNPAVSCAFAARGDFPWKRVPAYVAAQFVGATAAALLLQVVVGNSAQLGGSYPGASTSPLAACVVEALLTLGLVSVILGTASGAQSIGIAAAIGVGGYIALAGLWAAPLSGASMNPARTFGPNFVGADLHTYWVYIVGPFLGAMAAVAMSYVLRGRGGGRAGSLAAQGVLDPEIANPNEA